MKFIIGSRNQAKVKAATEALVLHYPNAEIISADVGSGVSGQPFGDEETRLGAINRALRASNLEKGVIGIGLEGGVRMLENQMYICNWGALMLPNGASFTAGGAQIPVPQTIATELLNGKELGPVIESLFNSKEIRNKEGAMGILTEGTVNRNDLFIHICDLLIGQMKYSQKQY